MQKSVCRDQLQLFENGGARVMTAIAIILMIPYVILKSAFRDN